MEVEKKCSYDFKPFTKEEYEHYRKYHTKEANTFIRVGPTGTVLPTNFLTHAEELRNMPLRSDDVFVCSYPRSGTTWTQELVWLVANDLDFEKAKSIPLNDRFPYLEFYMYFAKEHISELEDEAMKKMWEKHATPIAETLKTVTSRRFIKTHLPLSLLTNNALDTSKVVYVARDMRDVAVSCYHFYKANNLLGIECDFNTYYENMFARDMLIYSPFFEHIKEAWNLRDHPNLLFLFYEDLSKDLKKGARRVAEFLGKQYTDEQLDGLCEHLHFSNFQKNKALTPSDFKEIGLLEKDKNNFIRKGKAGGWREHFNEKNTKHAEKWIAEQLQGTGINFLQ